MVRAPARHAGGHKFKSCIAQLILLSDCYPARRAAAGRWIKGQPGNMKIKLALLLFFIAAASYADGGLQIVVEENNTGLSITSSKGSAKTLDIPQTIDGKIVTRIEDGAFTGKGLTEVTIPDSVTIIGDGAFAFNRLETVTIGNNVTSIGRGAFTSNRLRTVTLGSSVTGIGKGAFSNNLLAAVELPSTVTVIDDYAFFNNKLNSIEIPASVTLIGEGAFSGNRLTSIEVGAGVANIRDGAFYNNKLTSVTIPPALQTLGKRAFDARSPDGRIRGNVVYTDSIGNVLYTTANNFDAFYASNGKKPGRYTLSEGSWSLE